MISIWIISVEKLWILGRKLWSQEFPGHYTGLFSLTRDLDTPKWPGGKYWIERQMRVSDKGIRGYGPYWLVSSGEDNLSIFPVPDSFPVNKGVKLENPSGSSQF